MIPVAVAMPAGHRVMACLLLLISAATTAHGSETDEFQTQLEQAAELNVSAPWRESQKVLDELRPRLAQASAEQVHLFHFLEARNLVLSGDLEHSLVVLDELLEQDLHPRKRLRSLGLAANAALFMRRYERVFDYLDRALEMAQSEAAEGDATMPYSLAAYVFAQVEQFERARHYGHLGLEQALEQESDRSVCVDAQRLAFVYKTEGEHSTARETYEKALTHCRRAGDDLLIGVVEYSLADLLRQAGEFDPASALFDQALARLDDIGYHTGEAEARLYRARLHKQLGEHESTEQLLLPSIEIFEADETWDYLAEAHGMLATIRTAQGDHDRANQHLRAQLQARNRFLNMERARQLAYLEVAFDTRFKEQELALLREQARITELQEQTQRQRHRLRLMGYIVAAFLIIVLVLLLVHATGERRRYLHLARHDGLTSLNNHTAFFEVAESLFQTTRRDDSPFTLILTDIDHFKRINDQHGHLVGDQVLKRVGARLREVFGQHGIIGRIGGEEFGIALPGLRQDQVGETLAKLQEQLQLARGNDGDTGITMSFGVAERTTQTRFDQLQAVADKALYRAKHRGRNRIEYADDAQH